MKRPQPESLAPRRQRPGAMLLGALVVGLVAFPALDAEPAEPETAGQALAAPLPLEYAPGEPQAETLDKEETTPVVITHPEEPCARWLTSILGDDPLVAIQLTEWLERAPTPPPGPTCYLRALYLAADYAPDKGRQAVLYERGQHAALDLLRSRDGWAGVETSEIDDRLAQATVEDAPALFWVGWFWGHRLPHMNKLSAATEAGDVTELLRRVAELAPEYYAGAAHCFLGGYYAELPLFFGRDFDLSKEHFDSCVDLGGENLARRWTRATTLLEHTDQKQMDAELKAIAEAKLDPQSPFFPENLLAKGDARRRLKLP